MPKYELGSVVEDRRVNAAVGWLMVGFLLLVVGESLPEDLLWAGFAAVVAALAVLPAVRYRNPLVMLPWEVLVLAALPVLGRSFATVALTSDLAMYLAVAAVALIIAVELHLFTPVSMTPGFAVLFVVVATMATAGIWAVARWLGDLWLNTQFFHPPGVPEAAVETALMWEFVFSTVAGIAGGLLFQFYFRRRERGVETVPSVDRTMERKRERL
jgi:hypothetical protein